MTPFAMPDTDTWMEGDLHVALARPSHAAGPVPTVLLLDGHTMFATAVEYARTVSLVTLGALPPMAIVAVWRDSNDPLEYFSTRFRDFTPYEWVLPEPFAAPTRGVAHPARSMRPPSRRAPPAARSTGRPVGTARPASRSRVR